MTREEAFKLHQCKGCVLWDSKRNECKKLDISIGGSLSDCPVDNKQHRIWEKQVKERRLR